MSEDAGRLVGKRYRLGGVLGRGGMGTVWRAEDEILGRTVAVKELRFPASVDEDEKQRLVTRTLREAKAIARIRSGSAVTVFDVVDEDGRPWIVMELVEGRSLADQIREDGPLEPQRAAEVGLAILDVLRAAHREGILHRDVKPSNVLLEDGTGRVVLTDFGIAKVEGDPSVTSTGMLVGAPSYISPERARGKPPGPPADLWSLGGLLFAAVEGRPPYDKGSAISTLTAVMTEPVPEPERAGGLREVIFGLLAKDPDERLDVAAAQALLRPVAAGEKPGDAAGAPADATRSMPVPPEPEGDGASSAGAKGGSAKGSSGKSGGSRSGKKGAAAAGVAAVAGSGSGSGSGGSGAKSGASGAASSGSGSGSASGAGKGKSAGAAAVSGGLPAEAPAAAAGTSGGGTASGKGSGAGASGGGAAAVESVRAFVTGLPRRAVGIAAAVVVAVCVLVGAVALSTADGDDKGGSARQESGAGGEKPSGASGKGDDAKAPGDGGKDEDASGSDDAAEPAPEKDDKGEKDEKEDKGDGGELPEAYRKVTDNRFHFALGMPDGFEHVGIAGQNSGARYAGSDGLPKIQIDFNARPLSDAASAWRQLEPSVRASSNGYQRLSLKSVDWRDYPTVADWQFLREEDGKKVRVLNRGFKVDDSHGYAIMITCAADKWDEKECKTLRETAFKSFKPTD
ncbi:serine/threonine-protein kinase [Streptomyces sp. HNM0574]|uniref:serine/threonine-protein kinase n=1 Tax=Streptomyces sp. HNM0574 TaxID=2714954 RepID=UPI00146E9E5C|nr:serine/threonine-protein kinase [Streptomyces sp. HNM0574]NLU66879.1 serine/threonine protein kinase [Streptomyces sp. HNM0574]